MLNLIRRLLGAVRSLFGTRRDLALENLALRHQIGVLERPIGERRLRRVLRGYFDYYHRAPCHLSLEGDAPESRPVHGPELGRVVELPEVCGLHHRYLREAA
jgi:hypothetical protein